MTQKRTSPKKRSRKTRDAGEILDRVTGDDEKLRKSIERETLNAKVAMMVYEARTRAGLTQEQLAELVGTKQPVIARLEDADYEGHSLSMLQRIAAALNAKLELRMVPAHKGKPAA
jgi:ribosome-binding protein aMBF1 (putative translation factor)